MAHFHIEVYRASALPVLDREEHRGDRIIMQHSIAAACQRGRFQFRLDDGTCKMYWLSADCGVREQGEALIATELCQRSPLSHP